MKRPELTPVTRLAFVFEHLRCHGDFLPGTNYDRFHMFYRSKSKYSEHPKLYFKHILF